ncbi:hypothetical protein [Demequina litorisediminis]|nr:hypothetical protein [Demequina litorisediminis]
MRGVQVTILDDRGAPIDDGEALGRMVQAIVEVLAAACTGSVTVRLLPAGRDTALSLRRATDDEVERLSLGQDGYPLTTPPTG